jgi:hypothetical protein
MSENLLLTEFENEPTKMGVNWEYLNTLLNLHNDLLASYKDMLKAHQGMGNKLISYKKLCISLSSYYIAVCFKFDEHLTKLGKNKENPNIVTSKDYIILSKISKSPTDEDINKIIELTLIIVKWSQKEGAFATSTLKRDPNKAWSKP